MADSSRPHEPNDDSLLEDIREETRFMLRSWIFDVVIGSIIALNAVSISVEQSLEIKGHDTTSIKVIESVFLTIYIIELGLRFFCLGSQCFARSLGEVRSLSCNTWYNPMLDY